MDLRQISAIDMHTHYNHGSQRDTKVSEVYSADLDYIRQMSLAANIMVSFASTFASVLSPEGVVEENAYNYARTQEIDWLFQWAVIEPRIEATFEQAEQMLKNRKCVGIKIHPANHGYALPDHADRLFSFAAERNAIILTHPDHTAEIPRYADKYPDMTLIIAHLGSVEQIEAIRNARCANIFVDTSGRASSQNRIIEHAVEQVGSDRILFGTDTYAAGFQRGRIEYALISDEDKANILYKNALKLFRRNLQ